MQRLEEIKCYNVTSIFKKVEYGPEDYRQASLALVSGKELEQQIWKLFPGTKAQENHPEVSAWLCQKEGPQR